MATLPQYGFLFLFNVINDIFPGLSDLKPALDPSVCPGSPTVPALIRVFPPAGDHIFNSKEVWNPHLTLRAIFT